MEAVESGETRSGTRAVNTTCVKAGKKGQEFAGSSFEKDILLGSRPIAGEQRERGTIFRWLALMDRKEREQMGTATKATYYITDSFLIG